MNYNKFEFQNPYQLRLEDFVNDGTIRKIAAGIGEILKTSRDEYIAIQDDVAGSWTVSSTLHFFRLGGLTNGSSKTVKTLTEEEMKTAMALMSVILSQFGIFVIEPCPNVAQATTTICNTALYIRFCERKQNLLLQFCYGRSRARS